ncbi:MAG: porin family protein [Moheibacter sp.]
MKKLFTISCFILALVSANAQVELWLGPKAGVNFSNISDIESNTLTGANFGVAFAIKFNDRYSLQPEMGFSMQGAKEVYNSSEDFKLQYFTVGVINKLYLVQGFHMLAGPEFNFKVNDTFSDWYDSDIYDDEGNYLGDTDAQPFDFMIVGGLGYDLPFGLTFEARYKQGLLDVNDFFNVDDDKSSLNQVFQIGIAYKFHLNK